MSSKTKLVPTVCCLALALVAPVTHAADYLAMSGDQLYTRFCASCHGAAGHGDGSVSKFLSVEVPDLSLLKHRQGSTYSREKIEKIIDGRFLIGAHGTRTMPIWGEDLARIELGNPDAERATNVVIGRLVDYLESIQRSNAPAPAK